MISIVVSRVAPPTDLRQQADTVGQHFASTMHATHTTFARHVTEGRQLKQLHADLNAQIPRAAETIIGTVELTPMLANAKTGNTCGPDLMPNELARELAHQLAKLYDPIAIRSAGEIHIPLQWRGGDLVALLKHHLKSPTLITNYRDI